MRWLTEIFLATGSFLFVVWLGHLLSESRVGPTSAPPPFKTGPAPIVVSEKLNADLAYRFLTDPRVDIAQRNEAANYLRDTDLVSFGKYMRRILDDPLETDLFKSWMIQHVGVMAAKLSSEQSLFWTGRLFRI